MALVLLLSLPFILYVSIQFFSIWQIIGCLILLSLTVTSLTSFYPALFFLILFLPLEPLLLKYISPELVVFFRLIPETIIFSLFAKGLLAGDKKVRKDPIIYSLIILSAVIISSALINQVEPINAVFGIRQLLRFILLYEALVLFSLDRERIKNVIWLVALIAAFEALLGLAQAVWGTGLDAILSTGNEVYLGNFRISQEIVQVREEGRRGFATMCRYDQLGTFLALICSAVLGFLYQAPPRIRKISLALLIILIPALILTYSRASLFGFVLAVFVVSMLIKRDKRVMAIILVLVAGVGLYTFTKEVEVRRLLDKPEMTPINRLLETFSEKRWRSEYRDKGRIYFIAETPRAIYPEHFLFGVGPGLYGGGAAATLRNTEAYDELNMPFGIYSSEGHVDSNWMSILGELGILGTAAYASIFAMLIIFARKVLKSGRSSWLSQCLALGLIGATMSLTFQGMLGTNFEVRTLAPYYWLLAALTVLSFRNDLIGYESR